MRLFVAIDLPEDIKQQMGALHFGVPDAKWSKPENAHLTLAFLGEISMPDMGDAGIALGRIKAPVFDLQIEGIGVFGNDRRPRVLWAGFSSNPQLQHLQQKITQALSASGISLEDRRFKPHITLARIHRSPYEKVREYLSEYSLFRTRPFHVDHFSLFSSVLGQGGPHYEEEIIFDLEPLSLEPTAS
ncbi:2'-5' RNA ligase [Alphaproteobacteria bacterium 46_93_T64]|nr:2'-5' RNA ligase [Alphaproteobacteria bacterium 46_93_T64]